MSKFKIMLSSPIKGKTKEEIDTEREEMVNLLFDYYGEDNCEIIASVVGNHEKKSNLECVSERKSDFESLSESIFFMSISDVLAMGHDWENDRNCRLEHAIANAYHMEVIYLDILKEGVKK